MPVFEMPIDEVIELRAEGTVVVTGRVLSGEIRSEIDLFVKTGTAAIPVRVAGIEAFSPIRTAVAGDNVAVLLRGISKSQIPEGSRLVSD
jgi:elongation factor Tu